MRISCPIEDRFGFVGTLRTASIRCGVPRLSDEDLRRVWDTACDALEEAFGEPSADAVERFLRAKHGRHFADEVSNVAHPSPLVDDLVAAVRVLLTRHPDPVYWGFDLFRGD